MLLLLLLVLWLSLLCPRFVMMCGGGDIDEFGDVEFNSVTES